MSGKSNFKRKLHLSAHGGKNPKNISVKITSGQKLSIVGLNGAGKTTFVKLLLRLYDPDEGRILLNGKDIGAFDYGEYTDLFSVVFRIFSCSPAV